MSTVPQAGDPAPADNSHTTLIGNGSGMYARPTAGGNASGDAGDAPAGPTPGYSINMTGAPVSTNGTQAGPDMGHGATQILTGTSGADMDNDNDTA